MNPPSVSLPARAVSRAFIHPVVLALCAAFFLGGCGSTSKDPRIRADIADLKAAHLAFIDEFTEGPGKTWSDQKLATSIAAMEKEFADVEAYEATKGKDTLRSKALSILHAQFKRNAAMLQRRKAFFRPAFAADLKGPLTENYDQALRGEDVRS